MIRLVTVARQYGSGGAEFASRLGSELGWPVHDRAISEQAASDLAVEASAIADAEERDDSLVERIEQLFSIGAPDNVGLTPEHPWSERVFRSERDAILRLAQQAPAILVGRGAQCLLRDRTDAFHVRVYSPFAERVARVARRSGLSPEAATRAVERIDRARTRFLRKHFACGDDDTLYTLQLNTRDVTLDEAVAVVSQLIRRRA